MRWLRRFFGNLTSGFGLFKALNPSSSLRGVQHSMWNAGFLRGVMKFFLFIVGLFWAAIHWVGALDWRLLLQGAPALTVGAVIATFSIMAMFTRAQELETRYSEQANAAMRAQNYKEALACYERLSQLQNDRPETLFNMALAAERSGDFTRCLTLMRQLAPPDKPGYARAQSWYGRFLLAQFVSRPDIRAIARGHLLAAVDGDLSTVEKDAAYTWLGDLAFAELNFKEAENYFILGMRSIPLARMRLAHAYDAQNLKVKAKEQARKSVQIWSEKVQTDKTNHDARIRWAEAVVYLEEFPEALKILEDGLLVGRDNKDIARLYLVSIAGVYVSWFDVLTLKGDPDLKRRISLLESGLKADPKNLPLLNRLLYITGIQSEPLQSPLQITSVIGWGAANEFGFRLAGDILAHRQCEINEARSAMRKFLARGEVTAPINFALGMAAWEEGDKKNAQYFWERAYELAPDTPVLANNLAWLLYQTDPSKLEKSLELVNVAIAKMPNETNFRDTRGHILNKMGRYREAASDLEAALVGSKRNLVASNNSRDAMKQKEGLHRTLAEVFDKLENPQMQAVHLHEAEELKTKLDKR